MWNPLNPKEFLDTLCCKSAARVRKRQKIKSLIFALLAHKAAREEVDRILTSPTLPPICMHIKRKDLENKHFAND
jgi:hypothetical protein